MFIPDTFGMYYEMFSLKKFFKILKNNLPSLYLCERKVKRQPNTKPRANEHDRPNWPILGTFK